MTDLADCGGNFAKADTAYEKALDTTVGEGKYRFLTKELVK